MKEGEDLLPSDDKVFAVPESILQHPLAVSMQQFFEVSLNPCNWKMVSGGGNSAYMGKNESHEPTLDIPPNRDKEKKPPGKPNEDVTSIYVPSCMV